MVWSLENMWWWRFLSIISDCWWMITPTASRCSMVHVILSNHKIIKPIGQSLQLYYATALCTHWPFQSSILLICLLLTLNGFYKTLFLSVEHLNCVFMSIKWMLFFLKILFWFSFHVTTTSKTEMHNSLSLRPQWKLIYLNLQINKVLGFILLMLIWTLKA